MIMRTLSSNLQNEAFVRANPVLGRPLILVAEDDEDTRVMFRTMLQMQGYRVIEACDGEKTVQMADRDHPDLILMDVSLPLIDGFDATRRIRLTGRVPIIFVSGYTERRFVARARQAGCDEYLVKPVDFHQLGEVIKKYTDGKGKASGARVDL